MLVSPTSSVNTHIHTHHLSPSQSHRMDSRPIGLPFFSNPSGVRPSRRVLEGVGRLLLEGHPGLYRHKLPVPDDILSRVAGIRYVPVHGRPGRGRGGPSRSAGPRGARGGVLGASSRSVSRQDADSNDAPSVEDPGSLPRAADNVAVTTDDSGREVIFYRASVSSRDNGGCLSSRSRSVEMRLVSPGEVMEIGPARFRVEKKEAPPPSGQERKLGDRSVTPNAGVNVPQVNDNSFEVLVAKKRPKRRQRQRCP